MREILFRGKRQDTGEWVFGLPFYGLDMEIDGIEASVSCKDLYTIAPETLGQYTGMRDRNGKRIFEGDIVQYHERQFDGKDEPVRDTVVYEEGSFAVRAYSLNNWLWDSINGNVQLRDVEIIGNIHDNPELMDGGAE